MSLFNNGYRMCQPGRQIKKDQKRVRREGLSGIIVGRAGEPAAMRVGSLVDVEDQVSCDAGDCA
jgi:hypothetical protein